MKISKQLLKSVNVIQGIALWLFLSTFNAVAEENKTQYLSFKNAISLAQQNDPWLLGNKYTQDSIESMGVAVATLPDPRVSIGVANIAADSLDFSQEQMTQFKVGVSQMFPRGDSLSIKQQQLNLTASQYPLQRLDRKAKLAVTVGQLWLDAFMAQQTIHLIEKDRVLFEQLVDLAQASYSSALGKTRQQDIIRAQLELIRLDDRLNKLYQKRDVLLKRLTQWIDSFEFDQGFENTVNNHWHIDKELPQLSLMNNAIYHQDALITHQMLFEYFSKHPAIRALQQNIKSRDAGVELAQQNYKPEWGINASYGYRDADPFGRERTDLFSIGVSFDLPIFTGKRQHKEVESAVYLKQAVKTQKWQLLRKFMASFQANKAQLERLNERRELYASQLLPRMHQQAEASLTAYTNDDGEFSEVVRARISDLNATIEALDIDIERQKTILQLNYYFVTKSFTTNSFETETGAGETR